MIKGKNIQLRLIKQTDLSLLYEKWHDAEIRGPYYPLALVAEPAFYQKFSRNGFWSDSSKRLLITDMQCDVLGLLHCTSVANYNDCIELSYILFEATKRNKGYATEAVILMINYLFDHDRLNRIQVAIPIGNKASVRVAEKAGFIFEGIAREAFFLNGKDIDIHIYSLLRREWYSRKVANLNL